MYLVKCAAIANDATKNDATKNDDNDNAKPTTVDHGNPIDFWIKQVINKVILCKLQFCDLSYIQNSTNEYRTDLCEVAMDLMAVPCTSTASERLFSAAGYLSQNRSSRISPKNLEIRCLLKTNPSVWMIFFYLLLSNFSQSSIMIFIKLLFVSIKFAWIWFFVFFPPCIVHLCSKNHLLWEWFN